MDIEQDIDDGDGAEAERIEIAIFMNDFVLYVYWVRCYSLL